MKVIYEPSVLEHLDAIIEDTFGVKNRRIARIEVDTREWLALVRELNLNPWSPESKCRDTTCRGVRVIYEP